MGKLGNDEWVQEGLFGCYSFPWIPHQTLLNEVQKIVVSACPQNTSQNKCTTNKPISTTTTTEFPASSKLHHDLLNDVVALAATVGSRSSATTTNERQSELLQQARLPSTPAPSALQLLQWLLRHVVINQHVITC